MPNRTSLGLALSLALGAGSAAAAEPSLFDFYVSGFKVGELSFSADEGDGRYSAASSLRSTGLANMIADLRYEAQSVGRLLGDGTVEPSRFTATSRSTRADRVTEIEFDDGTPVHVSVEPPRSTSPDPAAQDGTLDPVSAGFAVLRDMPPEAVCDTTVELFDGSRRTRLVLAEPALEDGRVVCDGTYARIEGEAHSLSDAKETPFRIVFRPNGDGLVTLDRIEAQTRFGRAVLERRG